MKIKYTEGLKGWQTRIVDVPGYFFENHKLTEAGVEWILNNSEPDEVIETEFNGYTDWEEISEDE